VTSGEFGDVILSTTGTVFNAITVVVMLLCMLSLFAAMNTNILEQAGEVFVWWYPRVSI
jgi:hypothetical protein